MLEDAKHFVEASQESNMRKPMTLYCKWSSLTHMTIVNMARGAALWKTPQDDFISSGMEKNEMIQKINEVFEINGLANQNKGLIV